MVNKPTYNLMIPLMVKWALEQNKEFPAQGALFVVNSFLSAQVMATYRNNTPTPEGDAPSSGIGPLFDRLVMGDTP